MEAAAIAMSSIELATEASLGSNANEWPRKTFLAFAGSPSWREPRAHGLPFLPVALGVRVVLQLTWREQRRPARLRSSLETLTGNTTSEITATGASPKNCRPHRDASINLHLSPRMEDLPVVAVHKKIRRLLASTSSRIERLVDEEFRRHVANNCGNAATRKRLHCRR